MIVFLNAVIIYMFAKLLIFNQRKICGLLNLIFSGYLSRKGGSHEIPARVQILPETCMLGSGGKQRIMKVEFD
jgi:hypothetical protein